MSNTIDTNQKPKSKKSIAIIIVALILAFLFISFGIYWNSNREPEVEVIDTSSSSSQSSSSSESSEEEVLVKVDQGAITTQNEIRTRLGVNLGKVASQNILDLNQEVPRESDNPILEFTLAEAVD